MKDVWQALTTALEPFRPTVAAVVMWLFSHLSTATAIVAFLVLLFNLRVVYYNGRLKKMEYDKACKGE